MSCFDKDNRSVVLFHSIKLGQAGNPYKDLPYKIVFLDVVYIRKWTVGANSYFQKKLFLEPCMSLGISRLKSSLALIRACANPASVEIILNVDFCLLNKPDNFYRFAFEGCSYYYGKMELMVQTSNAGKGASYFDIV